MKKILAVLLASTLTVSCFSGCGTKATGTSDTGTKSESTSALEADQTTKSTVDGTDVEKVVILYPGEETDAMDNFINNELNPRLAKEAGIQVEMLYKGWDQYWEQKDIMLAANATIDLYWDGLPDLSSMVNKSQCQPLDDLIKQYAPNLAKVIPDTQMEGGVVDGVQYGIPSAYAPSSCMYQLVCARKDIMDDVGMDTLETPDDLKEFATLAAEKYPDMNDPADIIFKPLTRYYSDEALTWCAYSDSVVYGETTKKAYSYFETDAFKKVAQFNQSMYDAGLYKDELTTNYNERDTRMQQGTHLWVEGSLGKNNEILSAVKANAPEAELQTYLLKPDADKYITSCGGEVLCVPYSAKNPAGAMKFLNWLYASQENYLYCIYGPEGENYTVVDGKIKLNDSSFEGYFYEWMFRNKNYTMFTTDVSDDYIKEYNTWDDNAKVSDVIAFHFDNSKVLEIETAISEVIKQRFTPIECGFVDFDSNYQDAVDQLKAAGIDEYVAEVQRQLDEYLASKK